MTEPEAPALPDAEAPVAVQTLPEAPDSDPIEIALPPRRVRVIVNANSGAKGPLTTNDATEDDVRAAIAAAGLGDEIFVTTTEEEAIALVREAADAGYDVVAAAGGDGTAGLVAGELVGRETVLGVLPLGSVMNIARMLDIPRELEAAAQIIATGRPRAIDVGVAKGTYFYEGGSVGLNALMFGTGQLLDEGKYHVLFYAVWVLFRYRPARMIIHLDDRVLTTRALAVAVSNGPYTGLGFTVAPNARVDDGLFDVTIFSRFSTTEFVRHFRAIAFGRRQYSPKVRTFRSSRVQIEGVHPQPCRADAIDLGDTPVTFHLKPRALNVMVPVGPEQSAAEARAALGAITDFEGDDHETHLWRRLLLLGVGLLAAGLVAWRFLPPRRRTRRLQLPRWRAWRR